MSKTNFSSPTLPLASGAADCFRQIADLFPQKSISPARARANRSPKVLLQLPLRAILIALVSALLGQDLSQAQETAPVLSPHNQLTPEQVAEGYVSLFDGKTLDGWKPTRNADWKVVDGEIRVTSGDAGWLMTNGEFTEYDLHVEFKAPATTNSGVFLSTPLAPTDPAKDCYEVNIAPTDDPFPTGAIVGRKGRPEGWKLDPHQVPRELATTVAEGWTTFDITVRIILGEGRVVSMINGGQDLLVYKDPQPIVRGHIGLQFRKGEIAFRNIRLRELAKFGLQGPTRPTPSTTSPPITPTTTPPTEDAAK
jgi:hypothetical protein